MVLHLEDGKKSFDEQLLLHIEHKRYDEVVSIIEKVDVKRLVDSSGMTLLHHSVMADNAEIVNYLLQKQCKVDALDIQGNTPLMLAVMNGHESIAEILLDAKANVFICNQDNQMPMSVALTSQSVCNPRLIYMFFDVLKKECTTGSCHMASVLVHIKCPFPRVMYFEDVLITECMLNEGCTVHDRDPENGSTALHYAVKFHDVNNVKLLLERGADINAEDKSQRKPLHSYESPMPATHQILTILWEHGATLDTHSRHDYNLAGYVLQHGDVYEVEALLLYNIDFNARNARGKSLLSFVAKNTNAGVIELLQDQEFDVNAADDQLRTALWYAIRAANLPATQFLLNKGANPNNVLDALNNEDVHFELPEDYSSFDQWRTKCLGLLLQYGFNLLSVDVKQRTIFEIASEERNSTLLLPVLECVAMMIALGRYVDERVLAKIRSHAARADYISRCQTIMEAMKATTVHDEPHVTLFDLLMAPKEQLQKYAQNTKTFGKLQYCIRRMCKWNFTFVENLRNCIECIVQLQIAELRKQAALKISKIIGLKCDPSVIDKIVMFLDKQSLDNVCQI